MKPDFIKSEADYKASLARIEEIFDAAPNTPDSHELDLLTTLVESYEVKVYPIDLPEKSCSN